jgi:hypothetical protein
MVGLWSVRNVLDFHQFFFVSTNSGLNLLLGNSPHAGADTGISADIGQYTQHAKLLASEVAQNAYYQQEAISWIVHNPGRAADLYALKFLNFFNSSNQLATQGVGSGLQGAVLTTYYALLGVLLVVRLALWRRLPLEVVDCMVPGYVLPGCAGQCSLLHAGAAAGTVRPAAHHRTGSSGRHPDRSAATARACRVGGFAGSPDVAPGTDTGRLLGQPAGSTRNLTVMFPGMRHHTGSSGRHRQPR